MFSLWMTCFQHLKRCSCEFSVSTTDKVQIWKKSLKKKKLFSDTFLFIFSFSRRMVESYRMESIVKLMSKIEQRNYKASTTQPLTSLYSIHKTSCYIYKNIYRSFLKKKLKLNKIKSFAWTEFSFVTNTERCCRFKAYELCLKFH